MTHSAKFWKNVICQISPRPPNQCWSLFPALWSFRVWSTLCRGEGGKFYLGLGCSKIRQKRSSVSLLLKPIVDDNDDHKNHFAGCQVTSRNTVRSWDFEKGMDGWTSSSISGQVEWRRTDTSTVDHNTGPMWGHPKGSFYVYTHTAQAAPQSQGKWCSLRGTYSTTVPATNSTTLPV